MLPNERCRPGQERHQGLDGDQDDTSLHPGPPRGGRLLAVRFIDHHDRVGSVLFRRRSSAERYAAHVEARGGVATVYFSKIGAWSK